VTKKKNTTKRSWVDADDAPSLGKVWFETADLCDGKTLVRRGRPPKAHTKVTLNMRVDADIMEALRARGRGWQTQLNDALRNWVSA